MSIEQEIDTKIKAWIGESVVQNLARQARIDELSVQLAQAQQQLAQAQQQLAQAQQHGMVAAPPPEREPELFGEHKTNGAG